MEEQQLLHKDDVTREGGQQGLPGLTLEDPPCRTVLLRKDAFDEREMDFYEALYTQSQAQFGAYVESGTMLNNYAHIFDLLIRLRQVRLHPLRWVMLPLAYMGTCSINLLTTVLPPLT